MKTVNMKTDDGEILLRTEDIVAVQVQIVKPLHTVTYAPGGRVADAPPNTARIVIHMRGVAPITLSGPNVDAGADALELLRAAMEE